MLYKLYKTTIHVLLCKVRRKTYVFFISISAVILKIMVKITSIFGSYRFLRIAWHDIFSLSHHLLASWNLYIPRVAGSKSKCSSSRLLVKFNAWTSQRLLNRNQIPKSTIVLTWRTPACLKFVKTSNRAVENLPPKKLWVWAANDAPSHPPCWSCFYLSCPCRNAFW